MPHRTATLAIAIARWVEALVDGLCERGCVHVVRGLMNNLRASGTAFGVWGNRGRGGREGRPISDALLSLML